PPGRLFDDVREAGDGDASPSGQVPRATGNIGAAQAPEGLHDVGDVDEVARLRAVAVDHQRLAASRLTDEGRDDGAFQAGGLARTVDVRRPGDRIRDARHLRVPFRRKLVDAVVGGRRGERPLGRRSYRLAVDGA